MALAAVLGGCVTEPKGVFYWGNYREVVEDAFATSSAMTVDEKIALLEDDLAEAATNGRMPHPGLHAQLGYLLMQRGEVDAARKEFEAEKTLFPEATVLMDHLIGKLEPATDT